MIRETITFSGIETLLVNDDTNAHWDSEKPLKCNVCKKYATYLLNCKFDNDPNYLTCMGSKKCVEDLSRRMKFMEKDYVFSRGISCKLNTKKTRKSERSASTLKTRWRILQSDDFKCRACGSRDRLEVDHIIPVSKGGTTIDSNLQTLCFRCNRGKCDSTSSQLKDAK